MYELLVIFTYSTRDRSFYFFIQSKRLRKRPFDDMHYLAQSQKLHAIRFTAHPENYIEFSLIWDKTICCRSMYHFRSQLTRVNLKLSVSNSRLSQENKTSTNYRAYFWNIWVILFLWQVANCLKCSSSSYI